MLNTQPKKQQQGSFWTKQAGPLEDEERSISSSARPQVAVKRGRKGKAVSLLSSSEDEGDDGGSSSDAAGVGPGDLLAPISSEDELFPSLQDDAGEQRPEDQPQQHRRQQHGREQGEQGELGELGEQANVCVDDDDEEKVEQRNSKRQDVSQSALGSWISPEPVAKRRRVVLKKRRVLDEKGYYVTQEYQEEIEEEPEPEPQPQTWAQPPPVKAAPVAKKATTTTTAAAAAAKPSKDIRSFFSSQ